MKESIITINGKELTDAESATIRIALESFSSTLNEHGLGDDKHGKTMLILYNKAIDEIRKIIYKTES